MTDFDGTGTAVLIYFGTTGAKLWFNQSGNSYYSPTTRSGFPNVDDTAIVSAIDLLGGGTRCLVWSTPLPSAAGHQLRYVDLMGDTKPHLRRAPSPDAPTLATTGQQLTTSRSTTLTLPADPSVLTRDLTKEVFAVQGRHQ